MKAACSSVLFPADTLTPGMMVDVCSKYVLDEQMLNKMVQGFVYSLPSLFSTQQEVKGAKG